VDGTLGIVGGGRMGEAVLAGVVAAGTVPPGDIVVSDTRQVHLDELAARYGVDVTTSNERPLAADTVVLALKPQVLPGVLAAEGGHVRQDAVVVSLAAGATTATIEGLLPNRPAVVRVMSNTPALVGAAMSVVSPGSRATAEHVARARELAAAIGEVRELPESQLDAVTALSGSGPAYVFLLAEAMAEAGVLVGLSREDAVALATQTVAGAGALLVDRGGDAAGLREAVTSPGGTTAAALRELERGGLRTAVLEAVAAAVARGRELG
jgi:pyrroline-5-carboxylate reductase